MTRQHWARQTLESYHTDKFYSAIGPHTAGFLTRTAGYSKRAEVLRDGCNCELCILTDPRRSRTKPIDPKVWLPW